MARKKEIKVKYIDEVDIRKKTLFIRVDFNVPLDRNRHITDDTRIRAELPTINYALEEEAKVIVASHLGRPEGKPSEELNMVPVARRLAYRLHRKVKLAPAVVGPEVDRLKAEMQPGDVLRTYADVSDLERDIDFKPSTSIEEGLGKFVNWYKDYYKVKI